MAGIAVVRDDFAGFANVLAVVAAKAAGEIEVTDVVRMRLPIGLHFREEIGLKDALHFGDGGFDQRLLLRVQRGIVASIEVIQGGRDRADCLWSG